MKVESCEIKLLLETKEDKLCLLKGGGVEGFLGLVVRALDLLSDGQAVVGSNPASAFSFNIVSK